MRFSRSEKLLLFVLATIQFNHIIDFMIVMPSGPTRMRTFEISPAQFGILVSSYTFAATASGLLSSQLYLVKAILKE
jgi:predicted MFS family arabinose efflux permease